MDYLTAAETADKWRNFSKVIDRAMIACENSGHSVPDDLLRSAKSWKLMGLISAGFMNAAAVEAGFWIFGWYPPLYARIVVKTRIWSMDRMMRCRILPKAPS